MRHDHVTKRLEDSGREQIGKLCVPCFYEGKGEENRWQMQIKK